MYFNIITCLDLCAHCFINYICFCIQTKNKIWSECVCVIFIKVTRKYWHVFNTLLQAVIVETPQGIQYEGRRLDASKVKPHPCDVLTLGYYKCEYFCSSLILCCLWEWSHRTYCDWLLHALMTVVSSTIRAMAGW